jgi:UDP-N-acetyl-D-glucosamine dehydrogenase
LAGEINSAMPEYVVDKVAEALRSHNKILRGSKILMLGIAYKPNVDDTRESPSVEIMKQLQEHGAEVSYSDPWIPVFPKMRKYIFRLKSVDITAHKISSYDCVVIGSNHDKFDYDLIRKHAKGIVDTRGVYRHDPKGVVQA